MNVKWKKYSLVKQEIARETDVPEMFADTEDIAKVFTVRSNNELQLMTFYSNSLAFNYFILSQISGADVWYICDLTCSHNIGRMMVTLYMVLPMANMIPLHTLHMCINGTCNRDARCRYAERIAKLVGLANSLGCITFKC